jgi:hypothetical protein
MAAADGRHRVAPVGGEEVNGPGPHASYQDTLNGP